MWRSGNAKIQRWLVGGSEGEHSLLDRLVVLEFALDAAQSHGYLVLAEVALDIDGCHQVQLAWPNGFQGR